LVSLSLHLAIGLLLVIVVVPKIPKVVSAEAPHYCIALSRVVPTQPPVKAEPQHTPPPVAKPAPVRPKEPPKIVTRPKPVKPAIIKPAVVEKMPAVEPAPVVEEEVVETAPEAATEEVVTETVSAAQPEEETAEAKEAVSTPAASTVGTVPQQSSDSYMDEHLAIIAQLLESHLYYPRMARKRHIEGEVVASFRVDTDGTVHDVRIQKHARAILDRAAVRTITSLSGLMPHPQHALTLNVPIRFVLK